MKQTQIEKIVAQLQAEKAVIDGLLAEFAADPDRFQSAVEGKAEMLRAFIARLTNGVLQRALNTSATKPPRTRKRKATEEKA